MKKKVYITPTNGSSQPKGNYGKALLSQNGYWTLKDMGRIFNEKYLKVVVAKPKDKEVPPKNAG